MFVTVTSSNVTCLLTSDRKKTQFFQAAILDANFQHI